MIKKHFIPCTVILTLLVMANLFTYTLPTSKLNPKEDQNFTLFEPTPKSVFDMSKVGFANEILPTNDIKVNLKMKRILASFTYQNLKTNRLHRKAAEWFPVIEPVLAAYGIPNDFKYVPLVESGLRSGTSAKGAAGFWQFMPATARRYGLKINGRIDERKNLYKSTVAACKYIKKLHGVFNNWTLVAAAYNVGDGHMRRQITKQSQANYFKMKLNKETGGYVYKLISMKEILENPARNGYKNQTAFVAYQIRNSSTTITE